MIVRTTLVSLILFAVLGVPAHSQDAQVPASNPPASPVAGSPRASVKHGKVPYTGPSNIVVLPPTPMLDGEGKQRVDPDGKLMFNPEVKQIRDRKGHPVFDPEGKPVFQTASDPGYNEKGKKIGVKKEKPLKMTPISINAGTLTVDGWTGKARLNYDIADLKYIYVYAPGVGTSIISPAPFAGAKEQPGAFNDNTMTVTVDGHPIQLSSDKRLLGKKPQSAWVAVDRSFLLPARFPVLGYGTTIKAPYTWPGSKEEVAASGVIQPPPLPPEVRPDLLLTPCAAGMMRAAGPAALPGQKTQVQPCVAIPAAISPPAVMVHAGGQ